MSTPSSTLVRSGLRPPLLAAASCAVGLVLAACGSAGHDKRPASGTAAGKPAVVVVDYHDIEIVPAQLTIKVGTTVKWENLDDTDHNVTSESGPAKFASRDFGKGGSFEYTFDKTGVVNYDCSIHPTTMQGTITVVK